MKKTTLAFIALMSLSSVADAASRDYACIAAKLRIVNRDVFYNVSPEDIDGMLNNPSIYTFAADAARECDPSTFKSAFNRCVAGELARVSPRYEGLHESDVITMLTIPEMAGHLDAMNAAKSCQAD